MEGAKTCPKMQMTAFWAGNSGFLQKALRIERRMLLDSAKHEYNSTNISRNYANWK